MTRPEHKRKFNDVFEYIENNLNASLSLEELADVACLSPFHFHRIFKLAVGETLNEYITRKRVELSASALIHRPERSVEAIALSFGFNAGSSLTRTFKKFYSVSPSVFRAKYVGKVGKIRQTDSKNGQVSEAREKYLRVIENLKKWIMTQAKVSIKEMPGMRLAYVSCMGEQNLQQGFAELMRWATPRGLLEQKETKVMTIYYDSFKITEPDKVRMSACIAIAEDTKVEEPMSETFIEPGKCLVGSYTIHVAEFEQSWTALFLWMRENGYQKADRQPFEIYHNNFNEHPEKKCIVDFCIPVE